jgi:hypothetical protein
MAGSAAIAALKLNILNSALQVDLQTNQVHRWLVYRGALSAPDIYKE